MALDNMGNAPQNTGNYASTLRTLLNQVSAKNAMLPAVAARGATVRQATYATTGTRAFDVVQAIASGYPLATPYSTGTGAITATGSAQTVTITSKAGANGINPIPVYGLYIRVVASNQISLGGFTLTIGWETPNLESMNNVITIDPAIPTGTNGSQQVELWVFPASSVLGKYVYTPASLRLVVTSVVAVQTCTVAETAGGLFPTGTNMFVTALTRGQREIDDVFSSYVATTRRAHATIRGVK